MPSEKKVFGILSDEDYDLFSVVLKEYGIKQSELVREIVHSWLFANKLHFNQKKKKG